MKLQIQKLKEEAVVPQYAHPGDAGMDFCASEDVTIEPGQRALIPTGIAMAIPEGYVALVWDKSGRASKDGVTTMAGVIDSGYRGEIQILMFNTTEDPWTVNAGEKVAQILIQPIAAPEVEVVESLDETSRGAAGFGSTGLSV
jgi:dUTP pyrophosphatase